MFSLGICSQFSWFGEYNYNLQTKLRYYSQGMHHPPASGEEDKNFRKVFAVGDQKKPFFSVGVCCCRGEGGGLSKFEVNLKLHNTSIKSIFGITNSI